MRQIFRTRALKQLDEHPLFSEKILFSDEVQLWINMFVNNKIVVFGSMSNQELPKNVLFNVIYGK